MNICCSAITDVGLVRHQNEDSYLVSSDFQLWAVADGMGGYQGGEVASAIAVYCLKQAFSSGINLDIAIKQAHLSIQHAAIDGLGSSKMGSTMVALNISEEKYHIAWVGDSRVYLYRSELTCLSKDHSYIQMMLDQGLITQDEAERHPYKHVVTRSLGGAETIVKVDSAIDTVQPGDTFLLCSDGLSSMVSDVHIAEIIRQPFESLSNKVTQLKNLALKKGGKDNVTVMLIQVD